MQDVLPNVPRPSRILWNDGDGTFTEDAAIGTLDDPRLHASVVDFDGDGWTDFVTTIPAAFPGEILRGNGDSTWTDVTASVFAGIADPLREAEGLTWGDYDNDGDLDLFAAGGNRGVWDWAGIEGDSLRFYAEAAIGGQKEAIFTTDGDSLTLSAAGSRYQAVTCFHGGGGDSVSAYPATFPLTSLSGVPPLLDGTREGLFLWSATGASADTVHLVVSGSDTEALFAGGHVSATGAGVLSLVTGGYDPPPPYASNDWTNRLFRNDGGLSFAEVTTAALPDNGASINSKGATWGDYDNDGWIDLYVANGGTVETGNEPNRLYRNLGDGTFAELATVEGVSGSETGMSDGAVWVDVDVDGFLDLFVDHGAEHPPFGVGPRELFRNVPNGNRWTEIALRGLSNNGSGLGAIVRFRSATGTRWRWQLGESDNCFANFDALHVGLGVDAVIDTLQITWPSGTVDTHVAVPADARWMAVEGRALRPAGAPNLELGVLSVSDTLEANAFVEHAIPVDNIGGAACDFRISCIDLAGDPVSWAKVDPGTTSAWPGGIDPLVLRLEAVGLSPGLHEARLVFDSNSTAGPDTVDVAVLVRAPAVDSPPGGPPAPGAEVISLGRPRPSPTQSRATCSLTLPQPETIDLSVVDVQGRRVRTISRRPYPGGKHEIQWDLRDSKARRVASGVYFLRLEAGARLLTRRIVVVD